MRFKKALWALLTLLTLALAARCSYFFEEKKVSTVVSIDRGNLDLVGCLDTTEEVFDSYFNSPADSEVLDQNVKVLTGCYREALEKFAANTKSGDTGQRQYQAAEIANFLQKVYPSKKFDLDFVANALVIKAFLIGGDATVVTSSEIIQLDGLLKLVGEGLVRLRPHRGILLQQVTLPRNQEGIAELDKAFTELEGWLSEVIQLVRSTTAQRSIDFRQVGTFLLREFYGESRLAENLPWLDLYSDTKKLLLNANDEELRSADFQFLVEQGTRTYRSLLEYQQFLETKTGLFDHMGTVVTFFTRIPDLMTEGEVLRTPAYDVLVRILDRTIASLHYSTRAHKDKTLEMEKVGRVLLGLEKVKLTGNHLRMTTLIRFLRELVANWLVDADNKKAELTEKKIDYLNYFIKGWSKRHEFAVRALNGADYITLEELLARQDGKPHKHWLELLKNARLKKWTDTQRLYFVHNLANGALNTKTELTYGDLMVGNSIFTEIEFFMERFQEPSRTFADYSLNKEQAQQIYELMRIIGLELGFMDGRDFDGGYRAYSEGNLFTPSGVDDGSLTVVEGFELMSIMYSSDTISRQMYEDIPGECRDGHFDILHHRVVKPACYRDFLFAAYNFYFTQLEAVSNYWGSVSDAERLAFVESLDRASRDGAVYDREYSMVDIRVIVSMTYYLESMFHKFDLDFDQVLSPAEQVEAEKHFRAYLAEIREPEKFANEETREKALDNAKRAFRYILFWEKVPTDDAWGSVDSFLKGVWQRGRQVEQATFNRAVNIFGAMSTSNRYGQISNLEKFLKHNQPILLHELELYEAGGPDCLVVKASKFCEFARFSNCSFAIYGDYFDWLLANKSEIFADGKQRPMTILSRKMNRDPTLSTQCRFPYVENSWEEPKSTVTEGSSK